MYVASVSCYQVYYTQFLKFPHKGSLTSKASEEGEIKQDRNGHSDL